MIMEFCFRDHHSTFVVELLKDCAKKKDVSKGIQLHAGILRRELLHKNPYVASALINMYARCGELGQAQKVLEELHTRDVVSWSSLISGYARQEQGHEALKCFERMRTEAISPNEVSFICILKACGNIGAIDKGKQIHEEIIDTGLLDKNIMLGNALVDMYAKCGMLAIAQEVLEELPIRNVVSWNALIAGYTQQNKGHDALDCFSQMQREGLSPDEVTFTCILKACGSVGDIEKAKEVHDEIVNKGLLERNVMVGNALVDMYAKSGVLALAHQVLENLPIRNVITWNALISGHVQHDQGQDAIQCFLGMQREGFSPDKVTFSCMLKACGSIRDIRKGKQIHNLIVTGKFLEKNIVLGSALVDMYTKWGLLTYARRVLGELPIRDVVSWSTLIAGYAHHNQGDEALACFAEMRREGLYPNEVTFTCILKVCSNIGAIEKGKQVHEAICSGGYLGKSIVLGTALVDMYAKYGLLGKAQEVLQELPVRDTVSWNALITGYCQHGCFHEALDCFQQMHREGLSSNEVTFACILKVCGSIQAIDKGKEIHDTLTSLGLLEENIVLGTLLVDMYAKGGQLVVAQEVIDGLPVRDTVCWNGLIAGYAEEDKCMEALNCFEQMQKEGLAPNDDTFICILKACGNFGAIDKGKEIHEEIATLGLLEKNILLGTALVDMYVKCDALEKAHQVLEELPIRDTVSWNALICGYAQEEHFQDALNCFEQMQTEGLLPNDVTFICILKACACKGDIEKGKQIHEEIVRCGLLEKNIVLGTALVDMYVKCGVPSKGLQVLNAFPTRDILSWSALIAGYSQMGKCHEALCCFEQLQREGLIPNEVTFVCILKVCGEIGALNTGKVIHDEIVNRGLLKKNILLGNALVDMYAKCGVLAKSRQVFEELPLRDAASYNALMAGYAQEGQGHEVLDCFVRMQREGIFPDEITFVCMLSACSHSGNSDDAQIYYDNMCQIYGITPTIEHHTCMVVVFGYTGCFHKAMSVIETMPASNDSSVWTALLNACRKWGNVKLGKLAFDQVIQMNGNLASAYVIMANIYAAACMQEEANKVDAMRGRNTNWNEDEMGKNVIGQLCTI